MNPQTEPDAEDSPMLDSFEGLLAMIRTEPSPCRLLTVLVRAETLYRRRSDGVEEAMTNEGLLEPLMSRDWAVTADLKVADILDGANEAADNWQFLMTAVLPGRNGVAPTSEDCEPHLDHMAQAIMLGAGLDGFAFFDRQGRPVNITGTAQAN